MKKNLSSSQNHRSVTAFNRKLYALLFVVLLFLWNNVSAGNTPENKGGRVVKSGSAANRAIGNIPKPGKSTLVIAIKRLHALAAPTISYNSPQTYLLNNAITPLAPASSGVSAPGYSGSTTDVYNVTQPFYAAVDGSGNLYISTNSIFEVKEVPKGGGSPVYLGNNLTGVAGIAVDGKGDVYIAAFNQNEIVEVPAGGGSQVVIGSGFNSPQGVAVDSAGNVYVADTGNNLVKEVPAGGGATITMASGFISPEGIAVDGAGNVYVTDYSTAPLKMIPAGNGTPVSLGSGFNQPLGVAVDPEGNVFVADYIGSKVWEVPAGGGAKVQIASGFSNPPGISVDGAGNLYIADQLNNEIKEVSPVGGYFIDAIPFGLSFNNRTGTLSGTPKAARVSTNYTVTAYNSSGSASAVINIDINPLSISYSSPQTYTALSAITPLSPVSSGVAAAGFNSTPVTLAGGFGRSAGVASDAAGNIYVADETNRLVKKIPAGGGTAVTIASGLNLPEGVAVDAAGNVYVAAGLSTIQKIPAGGGSVVNIGTGFFAPTGVAVDASGNVYVADNGNNAIKEILASGGGTITLGTGFGAPLGIAADAVGNVYFANSNSSTVMEIPAGGGTPVTLGSSFANPYGVAVDPTGNVYVADEGQAAIKMIPAGGGAPVALGSGYSEPAGVAIDPYGDVLAVDQILNTLTMIIPTGGYYMNKFLPSGLTFNNGTGVISGTPVVASPATNYTVTAYNAAGSNSAVVNIKVKNMLNLSYSSPQDYTVNTVITPLSPVSSGVAAAGFNSVPVTLASGFGRAAGVAADAAGNVYVADETNRLVKKIPAGGGTAVTIASGLNLPQGLAVDAAGNVYVACGTSTIQKIPAGGGATVNIGTGFFAPTAVAVDAAGNVYVADNGNNAVKEILASGGSTITLGTGFAGPYGVAVDASGNVYVANASSSTVMEIPVGGGTPVTVGSTFANPYDVAVDPAGNVYVADEGQAAIKMIPAGGGAPVALGSGYSEPVGVAIDPYGDVLAVDQILNTVTMIIPTGGYYLNKFLPSGLTFNNGTGVISGTPVVTGPATNYTVTAYNVTGSNSAVVNIKVNPFLISYNSPQIYTQGTAIPPLAPTSSGVEAPGYNNSTVSLGTDVFNASEGIAVDAAGNVYVADTKDNEVKKIPAGGGAPANIGSGFSNPIGVAVDGAGNVYVGDQGNNAVKEIPAGGGMPVIIGSGFASPYGVAVDGSGNVYVADYSHNAVKEILAGGGGTVTLGSGFSAPCGVAVDAAGNVYVANTGGKAVDKIPAGGGSPIVLASGFTTPTGVAVDASGNVFVADNGNLHVEEIPVSGGSIVSLPLAGEVFAVAVDGAGNVYAAESINGTDPVNKVAPVGGYYVGPFLPAGLKFNNTTGVLSGTPVVASPATNYTITAYNQFGISSTANLNITVNPEPVPTISYTTPHTYTPGIAIATLNPTAHGVAAAGYSSMPTVYGSGFSFPIGVATDAYGNVYVADYSSNAVKKILAGGGAPVVVASGTNTPVGVAIDAAGNLYVTNYGGGEVEEIPANGGTPISLGSGFGSPAGVAVDGAGNVYVADAGNNAVKEIPAGNGTPVVLGSGFSFPFGIAVDAAGNVYVADYGNNAVKKIPAGNGTPVSLGSGFNQPYGVAVDPSGNVFVADYGNNAVKELPGGNGTPVAVGAGYNGPTSVAIDPAGIVYVADADNVAVKRVMPVGGFYISASLPPGLKFNGSNGAISGTPTTKSPAANYTVTAYNLGGAASAVVNISVTPNANLAALKLSAGTLSPGFSVSTTSYTASVVNGVSSITVTPTTSDPAATVKVNGAAVTSGMASGSITLAEGAQTVITTIVTSQDGTATKTYTVTVTRAASTNASLSTLGQSIGGLTPAFSGSTTSYTISAGNATASITLKPVTSNANATIKVNGTAVTSGTTTVPIALAEGGQTIITTLVTAQDGSTTRTYTLTVNRAPSANANLSTLGQSAGGLTPGFSSGATSYTDNVSNATATMTLKPVSGDANATIKVNGTAVMSGTVTAPIALTEGGQTVITTMVTAQDGTTTKTYTLTVTRPVSANASLSALKLSSGTLSPVFATATTSYTAVVANSAATITITPATTDPNATIKVNGTTVSSGTATSPIALAEGAQTIITTVVTAQDGSTTKTYTVTVTRAVSANANLSTLGQSVGGLTPAFSSTTTSYTINASNATASMTLKPASSDAHATIKVDGTTVTSGTMTAPIALAVGPNTITTVVTAQNGTTTKTYTLTVTRASGGADSYVPIATGTDIGVTKPTETPGLVDDGVKVHQGVSPNGDGINDFLQIDNISQYPDNKLMIMNRNGQLIYEAHGYDNSSKVFDGHGSKNGQMQLPGTYFYQLDYTVNGIAKHKTGFLVLKY